MVPVATAKSVRFKVSDEDSTTGRPAGGHLLN